LLETHESWFGYNVTQEGGRERFKTNQIWQSAAKPSTKIIICVDGRFRDYNEEFLLDTLRNMG